MRVQRARVQVDCQHAIHALARGFGPDGLDNGRIGRRATPTAASRVSRGRARCPARIKDARRRADRAILAKVKIGRDGRFSLANIAGDIIVTGGSGDEVSIEAVKRTRGDQQRAGRGRTSSWTSAPAASTCARRYRPRNVTRSRVGRLHVTVPASASRGR